MRRINKRLNYLCFYFVMSLIPVACTAQDKSDFKTIIIDKQVKDFSEKYSTDTPLDAYIAISYIMANGREGMWRSYTTYRLYHRLPDENTPDETVSEKDRDELINRKIKECIVYKDSTAAVIASSSKYSIDVVRYLSKENGKWLNAGEDLVKTSETVINKLPSYASFIPMMEVIKQTPTDTINFVNYLKTHGKSPHDYILEKLRKHKIVIYGERHRRKVSWDLLRQIAREPEFVKTTGTIFFELPSHKQNELDRFYAQEKMDTDILLDIFSSVHISGWQDKDELDFMVDLWKLNKELPYNQKIKVILTDYQKQWDLIKTTEDLKNFPRKNRETNMADIIEQTIKTTNDKRNTLFIVGFMHAYKSSRIPGLYSIPEGQGYDPTAGAQLVERFSDEDVFCIFPHCMSESNHGEIAGKLRHGFFDYVFEVNHNIPVAFDLADSPFGKEPFDAGLEIKFHPKTGSYYDNYDGYIFFQKLEDEKHGVPLYELITDEYVEEIKRRAYLSDFKEDQIFYGVLLKELNKKAIIDSMKKYAQGNMWNLNN